jgi:hypothetical protein
MWTAASGGMRLDRHVHMLRRLSSAQLRLSFGLSLLTLLLYVYDLFKSRFCSNFARLASIRDTS